MCVILGIKVLNLRETVIALNVELMNQKNQNNCVKR